MTCTGGHGISIGSLGKDDADDIVDGVTVKNCVFENVNRAARIKAFRVSESNTGRSPRDDQKLLSDFWHADALCADVTGYAKNIVYTGNTVKSTTKSAICVTQEYVALSPFRSFNPYLLTIFSSFSFIPPATRTLRAANQASPTESVSPSRPLSKSSLSSPLCLLTKTRWSIWPVSLRTRAVPSRSRASTCLPARPLLAIMRER